MCVSVLDGGSLSFRLQARYDRLKAKPQALSGISLVPGASTVQSTQRQVIWRRHNAGWLSGYLMCVKESMGIWDWEGKEEWKDLDKDRKWDKGRVPCVLDSRLSESLRARKKEVKWVFSIFSSGFSWVVRQTLFLHNMCIALERTWSLWDYSLLYCDYMMENSAKVSHFWG